MDITDLNQIRRTLASCNTPDVLINCAAYTAVDKAEEETEKANLVNGLGVRNLALVCKELDIPLVHISTDYVFDGEKDKPWGYLTLVTRLTPTATANTWASDILKALTQSII